MINDTEARNAWRTHTYHFWEMMRDINQPRSPISDANVRLHANKALYAYEDFCNASMTPKIADENVLKMTNKLLGFMNEAFGSG